MRDKIPADSNTVAATRGIVTAAHHISDTYAAAVEHWTHNLTRTELVELVALLGCVLSMEIEKRHGQGGGSPS